MGLLWGFVSESLTVFIMSSSGSKSSGLRFASGSRASLQRRVVWQSNFSHTWPSVKFVYLESGSTSFTGTFSLAKARCHLKAWTISFAADMLVWLAEAREQESTA